jgi:hypothetical protein
MNFKLDKIFGSILEKSLMVIFGSTVILGLILVIGGFLYGLYTFLKNII